MLLFALLGLCLYGQWVCGYSGFGWSVLWVFVVLLVVRVGLCLVASGLCLVVSG